MLGKNHYVHSNMQMRLCSFEPKGMPYPDEADIRHGLDEYKAHLQSQIDFIDFV